MIQQLQISLNNFKRMTKKSNWRWLWYLLVLFGVISIWYSSYTWINNQFGDADGPGTFGDQFGAVNALFTGLSLAGIIITLWQQQQELNAQRREFMTSRAMTIVYKQVELIGNVVNNAWYNDMPSTVRSWTPELYKKNEIHGIYAVNRWNSILKNNSTNFKKIEELKVLFQHLLNSLSNSVSLLIKTKLNENMSDDDALFVFESFKYNIDHRVWSFIETLKHVNWEYSDIELEDIKNDVQNICSFLDEMESLKTKTNPRK